MPKKKKTMLVDLTIPTITNNLASIDAVVSNPTVMYKIERAMEIKNALTFDYIVCCTNYVIPVTFRLEY